MSPWFQFLSMDVLRPLIDAYKLDKAGALSPQIDVCKLLLSRASTPAEDISDAISMFPDL